MHEAGREITSCRQFLNELKVLPPGPTNLFVDNQTAILMTEEEGKQDRRKHINVKYHWIREQVANKEIQIHWVESTNQEADIMTKPLPRVQFQYLRDRIMGHQASKM